MDADAFDTAVQEYYCLDQVLLNSDDVYDLNADCCTLLSLRALLQRQRNSLSRLRQRQQRCSAASSALGHTGHNF
jgi:hypothetical protein